MGFKFCCLFQLILVRCFFFFWAPTALPFITRGECCGCIFSYLFPVLCGPLRKHMPYITAKGRLNSGPSTTEPVEARANTPTLLSYERRVVSTPGCPWSIGALCFVGIFMASRSPDGVNRKKKKMYSMIHALKKYCNNCSDKTQ